MDNFKLFLPPKSLVLFEPNEFIDTKEYDLSMQLEILHDLHKTMLDNQKTLHVNQLVLYNELMST